MLGPVEPPRAPRLGRTRDLQANLRMRLPPAHMARAQGNNLRPYSCVPMWGELQDNSRTRHPCGQRQRRDNARPHPLRISVPWRGASAIVDRVTTEVKLAQAFRIPNRKDCWSRNTGHMTAQQGNQGGDDITRRNTSVHRQSVNS